MHERIRRNIFTSLCQIAWTLILYYSTLALTDLERIEYKIAVLAYKVLWNVILATFRSGC